MLHELERLVEACFAQCQLTWPCKLEDSEHSIRDNIELSQSLATSKPDSKLCLMLATLKRLCLGEIMLLVWSMLAAP